MNTSEVQGRMTRIMGIFQRIQQETANAESIDSIYELLQREELEYRSIAYESASMELAVQDLSEGISLDKWYLFYEKSGEEHAVYIHVGLGWALAKLKKAPINFIENLEPLLKWRVVDGIGYYFGLLNRRRTIEQCEIPAMLTGEALSSFDQGVGRSIWYTCKGDIERVSLTIAEFSPDRMSDLWRGIGIACTFVGGCTERELELIYQSAKEYGKQLACGAVLACRARQFAKAPAQSSELAVGYWCNMSAEEATQLSIDKEPGTENPDGKEYKSWIQAIEDTLESRSLLRKEGNE